MKITKETCKNCEKQFDDKYLFCPYCGQQAKEELTVKVLFYNTINNYFSFDARFFKSFVPLMLKPGLVAKKFVEGKRLKYLHPAQYYLFVSVVFFFIFSFKVREYNSNADQVLKKGFEYVDKENKENLPLLDSVETKIIRDSILNNPAIKKNLKESDLKAMDSLKNNGGFNFSYDKKKVDSLIAVGAPEEEQLKAIGLEEDSGFFSRMFVKQLLKFHKQRGGGIVQAFFDSIPIALFFLLPLFAFILKLFYWKRGKFAHHLVFSFYYFSFLFIVLGLLIAINQWIVEIPTSVNWLIMLSTFIYLWLGLKRFYEQGYFISFVKAGLSTFVYLTFVVPAALIVIGISSFLFY